MNKVEYRPLSQSKHNCVWCVHGATQEAFKSQGNLTAICRCCDDPKCMWRSREMCESTVGAA
jgi:hypothetical protein